MHSSDHQIELAQWTAQRIKELISAHTNDPKKILDVGCGNGMITHYVQDILWESKVIGVDRDKTAIENAQKEFPEMHFFTCDDRLPFEDASVDCVYAAYVFHHLKTDSQKNLLREMMRVLTPNGLLIILEFNPWHVPTRWHFWKNPEEKNAKMISMNEAKKMLAEFGKSSGFYCGAHALTSPIYVVLLNRAHS
ncbi:class I SAM-dependent methyltransferase [Candidatus Dependentiae bacterium]|nr:class I SAM-dependent methyltransferase [Candidatus Dependentiae bacterium]